MSSTRSNNLPCNYKSEQQRKEIVASYQTYRYAGQSYQNNSPGFNVLAGQVGPSTLSRNYADVDSFLKGTYQNNLENPRGPFTPRLIKDEPLNFFNRSPVFLPQPIVNETCNRPHLV
jgi:hypothetical protein